MQLKVFWTRIARICVTFNFIFDQYIIRELPERFWTKLERIMALNPVNVETASEYLVRVNTLGM